MTRQSPRKKAASQSKASVTQSPKEQVLRNPRKPPHCTKCPGHPLRSQCAHTAKGKRFLLEKAAQAQLPILQPSSRIEIRSSNPTFTSIHNPQPASSPAVHSNDTLYPEPRVSQPPPFALDPALLNENAQAGTGTGTIASVYGHTTPQTHNFTSPGLFTPEGNIPTSGAEAQYSLNTVPTPNRMIPMADYSPLHSISQAGDSLLASQDDDGAPSSPTMSESPSDPIESPKDTRSSRRKPRATADSPIYGHVTGVYRGPDSPHDVHRTRPPPTPIVSSREASRAFLDNMNSIFTKCKDVALKTGCWLFIGAQHATASGGAFHYASPRLKKEGRQETNALATHFLQLVKRVSDGRKVDVLELQSKLVLSEQEKVAIQESKNEVESRLQAAELTIQEYRTRLGLPPN